MAKYKVVFTFSDGETYDSYEENGEDGVFPTEEDAMEYIDQWMSDYSTGGEILHLSNPGDYPLEIVQEEPDYYIEEI